MRTTLVRFRPPSVILGLLLLLLLAACTPDAADVTSPPPLGAPSGLISDGSRTGGNPDFFFLPPVIGDPSNHPNFSSGRFNPHWNPIVQICRLASENAPQCATPWLKTFARPQITVGYEKYMVDWDTQEAWATQGFYRVRVAVVGLDTVQLGHVDLQLVATRAEFRNTNTNETIPIHDGRMLPLNFRIEHGATVHDTHDFVEARVPASGGAIATNTGFAGMLFHPGWLHEGVGSVMVTIKRRPLPGSVNDCHSLGTLLPWLQQFEGCYSVETFPHVGIVQADVIAGMCSERPTYAPQVLYKSDPLPGGGRRVKALESVPLPTALASLITCGTFTGIASAPLQQRGPRMMFASGTRWLLNGVGRVLTPQSAYAIDLGQGGRLAGLVDDLSDFGWAVPASIAQNSGSGQSGAPGATLPTPLKVRAYGTHVDGPDTTFLAGVPVTFTASSGGFYNPVTATLEPTRTVISDANGFASVPLTLPSATTAPPPTTVTVTATIPDDSSNNPVDVPSVRTVVFTASVTPPAPIADSINVVRNVGPSTAPIPLGSSTILFFGQTAALDALVYDAIPGPTVDLTAGAVCTWSTSAPSSVYTVTSTDANSASLVAGGSPGTALLTVVCNGYSKSYSITVTPPIG